MVNQKKKPFLRPRFKDLIPYIMLTPGMVFIAVFMFYPIINTFLLSLRNYVLTSPQDWGFAGLKNYVMIFTQDADFYKIAKNSAVWTVSSVLFQTILGLILALTLNQYFSGRGFIRALIFSPWAVSGILVSIMWSFIYSETNGLLNDILFKLGLIDQGIAWFSRPGKAMTAAVIANVWRGIPFFAISFLSALQTISSDFYEAAEIDGAGTFYCFRRITLPLIKEAIVLTTLLRTIWTLNLVDLLWGLTRGGPNNATMTLPLYVVSKFNDSLDVGYAAALSGIMALLLSIFSITYLRVSRMGKESIY
jgi:multiple sugar transport system permease protein